MSLSELEQVMLLQKLPGFGSGLYWRLVNAFGSVAEIFEAPLDQLSKCLPENAFAQIKRSIQLGENCPYLSAIRNDLVFLEREDFHALTMSHPHYPTHLKEIARPPAILYVWGDPAVLSLPQIAIVGSRNPSSGGRQNAQSFARDLARGGFVITSGLALGVDVAAHQGALDVSGQTIAVMGTGIDKVYPLRHRKIAEEIVQQGGAVISEFPMGTSANAANFPQRNRIISGLSAGVLVVEAAVKSGSLISAHYAVQQNREVFAIPGSIHNPLSRGCHALIKDGAKLVECSADILEELGGYLSFQQSELLFTDALADEPEVDDSLEGTEKKVVQALGFDPCSLDDLSERTSLDAGALLGVLITLELKGVITPCAGGYARVRRAPAV